MKRTHLPIFNYRVSNAGNKSVDIYIDGDIVDASTQQMYLDWFGDDTSVSFKSFRDQINATDASTYNVYINSPGGLVTEAMACHDLLVALQKQGKTVNTIGTGVIASAATYILMAGDSSMTENSWFMIHNVSGYAYGDVEDMENQVKTVRKFNNTIRDFYAKATGKNASEIEELMSAETWYTGTEAKEAGFVKSVTDAVEFTNKISPDSWAFKNKTVLSAYNSAIKSPAMDPKDKSLRNKLLEFLGIDNKGEEAPAKPPKATPANTTSKEDIQKLVNEAMDAKLKPVTDLLQQLVKNQTEETAEDESDEDEAEDTETVEQPAPAAKPAKKGKEAEAEDDEDEDDPSPAETENTAKIKELEKTINKMKKQLGNKIGGPAKPGTAKNSASGDDADDPNDHEGVVWE